MSVSAEVRAKRLLRRLAVFSVVAGMEIADEARSLMQDWRQEWNSVVDEAKALREQRVQKGHAVRPTPQPNAEPAGG